MAGGVDAESADQSGSRPRMAAMVSEIVSPANAFRPVIISYSRQPKAQMSVRLSTIFPRACSGLIDSALPRMTPSPVPMTVMVGECVKSAADASLAPTFANPKSSTFTTPSRVMATLAAFRSRCTIALS